MGGRKPTGDKSGGFLPLRPAARTYTQPLPAKVCSATNRSAQRSAVKRRMAAFNESSPTLQHSALQ